MVSVTMAAKIVSTAVVCAVIFSTVMLWNASLGQEEAPRGLFAYYGMQFFVCALALFGMWIR